MNFEDLQKAWQTQPSVPTVTIETVSLLREVRRNEAQFRTTIFWRDVRESGVAFLLAAFFLYNGQRHQDWTDYLMAFACFGVGMFFVIDRMIQRKRRPVMSDDLKTMIASSLHQVKHQIWLLRNIFWFYLLPLAAALEISAGAEAWQRRDDLAKALSHFTVSTLIVVILYGGVYWLNQFAVRKSLEPRREELESLQKALE